MSTCAAEYGTSPEPPDTCGTRCAAYPDRMRLLGLLAFLVLGCGSANADFGATLAVEVDAGARVGSGGPPGAGGAGARLMSGAGGRTNAGGTAAPDASPWDARPCATGGFCPHGQACIPGAPGNNPPTCALVCRSDSDCVAGYKCRTQVGGEPFVRACQPENYQWCGDGLITGSEQCDGLNFGGASCDTITTGQCTSGSLVCTVGCRIDTTNCLCR